jgi:flagellar basal-body rod modification protein FlgD
MNVSASTATNASGLPSQIKSKQFELKADDFIKMMITQLQNQDPMEPAKNEQLLTQMSQIGQLQASTDLQTSLKQLVLQNNLSSAGSMIGKLVEGLDDRGAAMDGVVTAVAVEKGQIYLELDSGKRMGLSNVTAITSPT